MTKHRSIFTNIKTNSLKQCEAKITLEYPKIGIFTDCKQLEDYPTASRFVLAIDALMLHESI